MRTKLKFLVLTLLGFSSASIFADFAQAEGNCNYRVSLTTTYWYFEGVDSTFQAARRNAITNCIRGGTIPRICETASVEVISRDCYYSCTIVTPYGWVYEGSGSSREQAVNNAVIRCIRSGTIPDSCRQATVSCE